MLVVIHRTASFNIHRQPRVWVMSSFYTSKHSLFSLIPHLLVFHILIQTSGFFMLTNCEKSQSKLYLKAICSFIQMKRDFLECSLLLKSILNSNFNKHYLFWTYLNTNKYSVLSREECDGWNILKMALAFPIIKVMITLAFLSLAFYSQHRKMFLVARLSKWSTSRC